MKHQLLLLDLFRAHTCRSFSKSIILFFGLTSEQLLLTLDTNAQCSQSDIVITTNTTWINQTINMTEDQKIIVTNGATLTMSGCTVQRKPFCTGYWDGIHLITDESGDKAGLILSNGTRIEFSKKGIQALEGFSQITLDEAEMSDNGRMILARDNWPFSTITGNFNSDISNYRDGEEPVSVCDFGGCDDLLFPAPPKVIIRNSSVLKVLENGSTSVNPPKFITQISVLGAELDVIESEITNGQTQYLVNAIAAARGKCKIYNKTIIDGFWIGVYKGTDASAHCVSEGLVLTGSEIINTDLRGSGYSGFAIYNVSSDAFIKGNIIEANVYSVGTSYGSIKGNNIYYDYDADVSSTSVFIKNPSNSYVIFDNGLTQTPLEFEQNNRRTIAACNTWIDETYAFVANYDALLPLSWGTMSRASGNLWDITKSEMYNLSYDSDLSYYYLNSDANQIFHWYDGIIDVPAAEENTYCTYVWPADATDLDTSEYIRSIEDLDEEYEDIEDEIDSIIGHMDTSVLTVKEELVYLKSRLDDLVGQGLLFHTTPDSSFWTTKVDLKVIELLGLNYLWFGHDMYSITEHLESNPDPDAEALYEAADQMSNYFDNSKNLYNLTNLQVDTLQTIAESSYGDYTNILRNYLYMVYDRFIPIEKGSLIDSLRSRSPIQKPSTKPTASIPDHTVAPNPFTDNIQIIPIEQGIEDNPNYIFIYNLEGKLAYSGRLNVEMGQVNLSTLEGGFYILKIENRATGEIEIKRIYKDNK